MTRRLAAVLVAVGLMTGACASHDDPTGPGQAQVTGAPVPGNAELVQQRRDAGIVDCPKASPDAAPVAGGLPPVVLPCLGSDRTLDLSLLRGRPLVINLWAEWCPPCKKEAPVLASFAERAAGKVLVVGVDSSDPKPAAALAFAKASGWTYPQVADVNGLLGDRLGIAGIPVTLLVGADGVVVYRITGGVASVDQLATAVHERLGVAL